MPLLPEIFARTVAAHPNRIAVDLAPTAQRNSRETRTYAQLDGASCAIATAILHHGNCPPDSIVAILIPRDTASLYAAQLAVMRTGAAFTSLDPLFPDEHIRAVIADSQARILLTDAAGKSRLDSMNPRIELMAIDVTTLALTSLPRASQPALPWPTTDPSSLAYVIYTSGTTGIPKGVMIEHRSIANLINSDIERFALGPEDRIAQCSSPAYDSSLEETWLAFAVGAALVPIDDVTIRLGPDLVPWLDCERISVFCPPPTLLRTMRVDDPQRSLRALKLLYVGGEALPADLAELWSRGRWLENGYGPTECTVTVMRTRIESGIPVTIGRPVNGHTAFILDEFLAQQADGCEGELCIGGIGLARGYRNRPQATLEKFIEHPQYGRIYRTGDLARRSATGDVEYLGRIDGQIKLRGYRVELAAIDSVLSQCDGVLEAACCVQGHGDTAVIVAHIVPTAGHEVLAKERLRDAVAQKLPAYMVPTRFTAISALPRTAGGKIDRARLPQVVAHDGTATHIIGATTPLEHFIAEAFALAVRHSGALSVDDDFFLILTGDSLSAVGAICTLRQNQQTAHLTVRDLYECRTVRRLAQRASSAPRTNIDTLKPRIRLGNPMGAPYRTTIVQLLCLAIELVTTAATAYFAAYFALPLLLGVIGADWMLLISPLLAAGALVGYGVFAITKTVILKRILLGKIQPTSMAVFSGEYLRHWIVGQASRSIPWSLLEGTTLYCGVLRLLGARIGKRVHIHRGVEIRGGWDLLTIGHDVTLSQESSIGLVELTDGHRMLGPITIGDECTVGVRASLGRNTTMHSGSSLTALSWLRTGATIPANECWDGIAASSAGLTDLPPNAFHGKTITPLMHGAMMIGAQLLQLVVWCVPWMLAIWLIAPHWHTIDPSTLIALALGTAPLSVAVGLIAQAIGVRCMGSTRRGAINRWSVHYIPIWIKTASVEAASRWLSGTLLWPIWLRMAGMRIGRNCEISTIIDVIPDTVTIADDCFFADGIYFASPRVHRGVVIIEPTSMSRETFLGNHAVVPAGHAFPANYFVGVSTVADAATACSSSAWFGHPPMQLPRRDVVTVDRRLTHDPSVLRYLNRMGWELLRFTLPILPIAVALAWLIALDAAHASTSIAATALIWAPLVTIAAACVMLGAIIAMKWILLGRVRRGQHALWSCWSSRWDFLFMAWSFYARGILNRLEGTLLLNCFLRATGMHIGKRVVLGRGFTQVVDPDMLTFGDDATVDCNFQAHSFEDRVLKIGPIHIANSASVGHHAVLFYGAQIEAGAWVMPHSVVMKNQRIEADSTYLGCPAVNAND